MFDDLFEDFEDWRFEKLKQYAYEDGFAAGEKAFDDEEIKAEYDSGFTDGTIAGRG